MRPTRNIHQVADNTDFDNYIELPLVLGNNSEFEEDIYLFRIKGQSSTYNIAKSQPLQFSSHHRLQVSTEYSWQEIVHKYQTDTAPCCINNQNFCLRVKATLAASWHNGLLKATVTVNHQQTTAKFYVTKGSSGTLLRKKTAESLDLLHICSVKTNTIQQHLRTNQLVAYNATSPHHYPPKASEPSTDHIVQACSDVFHKNRELKNYKLQLYINHAVTLVQQPVRKIPLHTRKKVEKKTAETVRPWHHWKS